MASPPVPNAPRLHSMGGPSSPQAQFSAICGRAGGLQHRAESLAALGAAWRGATLRHVVATEAFVELAQVLVQVKVRLMTSDKAHADAVVEAVRTSRDASYRELEDAYARVKSATPDMHEILREGPAGIFGSLAAGREASAACILEAITKQIDELRAQLLEYSSSNHTPCKTVDPSTRDTLLRDFVHLCDAEHAARIVDARQKVQRHSNLWVWKKTVEDALAKTRMTRVQDIEMEIDAPVDTTSDSAFQEAHLRVKNSVDKQSVGGAAKARREQLCVTAKALIGDLQRLAESSTESKSQEAATPTPRSIAAERELYQRRLLLVGLESDLKIFAANIARKSVEEDGWQMRWKKRWKMA